MANEVTSEPQVEMKDLDPLRADRRSVGCVHFVGRLRGWAFSAYVEIRKVSIFSKILLGILSRLVGL